MNTSTSTLSNGQALQQELHRREQTLFPVEVELAGEVYRFDVWRGQQLPDGLLAYDTETAVIRAVRTRRARSIMPTTIRPASSR